MLKFDEFVVGNSATIFRKWKHLWRFDEICRDVCQLLRTFPKTSETFGPFFIFRFIISFASLGEAEARVGALPPPLASRHGRQRRRHVLRGVVPAANAAQRPQGYEDRGSGGSRVPRPAGLEGPAGETLQRQPKPLLQGASIARTALSEILQWRSFKCSHFVIVGTFR